MPKMQMLAAFVNLGGDRDNVVHRDQFNPISFPEALVLQVVHGGPDHVHTLIEVSRVDVNPAEERERLRLLYGKIVDETFPAVGGTAGLPLMNESLPTLEDVRAADEAASKTLAARKARKNSRAEPTSAPASPPTENTGPVIPDLTGASA